MNPRKFLFIIGPLLIVMGLLGIVGILGNISSASFFHPPYWINWIHLTLGIIVTCVALWGTTKLQIVLPLIAGILGLTLGIIGLLFGSYAATRFNIPELADPSDHVAHLTVGVLAAWAWLNRRKWLRSIER